MTVQELIKELQRMPPNMPVTIWDEVGDEWVPVLMVVQEDGCSDVSLLPFVQQTAAALAPSKEQPCSPK